MRSYQNFGGVLAIALSIAGLGAACGEDASSSGADQAALRGGAGEGGDDDALIDEDGDDEADEGEGFVPGDSDDLPPDFCVQGGSVGRIDVVFECDSITIISCKDLSNVVLEFADGTRQKFDGLNGQSASFSGTGDNAGKEVVGVWVKAGSNHSGDGPGYGERFDAPGEQACEEVPGDGDGDGDQCQPDEPCGETPGDGDGDGDGDQPGDGDGDGDQPGDGDGDGDQPGDGDGDGDQPGDGDGDGDQCQPDEPCGETPGGDGDGDGDGDEGCFPGSDLPCDPI